MLIYLRLIPSLPCLLIIYFFVWLHSLYLKKKHIRRVADKIFLCYSKLSAINYYHLRYRKDMTLITLVALLIKFIISSLTKDGKY